VDTLRAMDQQLLFLLNHLGPEGLLREWTIRVTATGLMYVLVGIVLYLYLRKPDGREVLLGALGSAIAAVIVGKVLNQILPRERPFVALPDQVRHIALIVRPDSFPSIHAVAAFGLSGGVLFGTYRHWGLAMIGLALLMTAARVASGVHWPSDVLGGAVIGLAAGAAVHALGRRWRHRQVVPEQAGREEPGAQPEQEAS